MQLITMNYLTSFPEFLRMYKWYVGFIIVITFDVVWHWVLIFISF
jgi:hypothetical protein